jgi:predicted LPLAT superfamily acyltransferase
MRGIAFRCGRAGARLLLGPIVCYFLIRRRYERRASRDYLERVRGRRVGIVAVARHFHCFAAATLDRVFLLAERFERFEIEVHGLDTLRAAMSDGRGVLLMGSHLGSFDALRVLALEAPDVTVKAVVDVDHNPNISRLFDTLNPGLATTIIHARQPGAALAFSIREALAGGALVALLADRARPRQETLAVPFLGAPAALPVAPWRLARTLRVPVMLCFGLYRGGNRYDLHFEKFELGEALSRAERSAAVHGDVVRYAAALERYARSAPYNWFNFYEFWQPQDLACVDRSDPDRVASRVR